jgi:hypothetical protein
MNIVRIFDKGSFSKTLVLVKKAGKCLLQALVYNYFSNKSNIGAFEKSAVLYNYLWR